MVLKKISTGAIVSNNLIIASSLLDRLLGLIIKRNCSLMLKTRWGIHTFFLKSPIDVVILNSDCRIVSIKKCLKPNSAYFWNPKFDLVLELPQNSIKRYCLSTGDKLKIV